MRVLATNDLLGTVAPLLTSTGSTGTVDGVAALLAEARETGPAIWVDSGDFTGGAVSALGGGRGWDLVADLPISAAAAGNHEFDDGVTVFKAQAGKLGFPLISSDFDLDLPSTTIVDTSGGAVGLIGLAHPQVDLLSDAPTPRRRPGLIAGLAEQLRRGGAEWILVLQHDGVTWWPSETGVKFRTSRLRREAATWGPVDAILGGHTLAAWSGNLDGITAGQAGAFASTVLVVDLTRSGAKVAGLAPVPAVYPTSDSRLIASSRLSQARREVVGALASSATSLPSAGRVDYLPDMVAGALRVEGAADAALLFSSALFTQDPIDGATAHLRAGDFTRLDLYRLFPFPDDSCSVIELRPGEFSSLIEQHDAHTTPTNRNSDGVWWNWNRTPCGTSTKKEEPLSMAVQNYTLNIVSSWLGRQPKISHQVGARTAFLSAVNA